MVQFSRREFPPTLAAFSALKGVKEILEVPVVTDGWLWGIIGLNSYTNRRWKEEEVHLLRITASSLGRALSRNQAKKELSQSEERFKALVETSPDGIVEMDSNGAICYANSSFVRMVGSDSSQDLIGKSLLELVHPEDRQTSEERLQTLHSQGVLPFHEEKLLRQEGEPINVEIGAASMADANRTMAIVRDVSQRQAAEDALRESENRFRTAVEVSPDGVLLIEPEFGRILYANSSYLRLVGATRPDQVVGQLIWRFIHPKYQNLVASRVMSLAQEGQTLPRTELEHLRLDGNPFLVEATGSSLNLDNSRIILSVIRDISERKRAEEAILASEARFKALIQNSLDMTLILDTSGQIIYASPNAVRIARDDNNSPKGNIFSFLTPGDLEESQNILQYCLSHPREMVHTEINAPINGEPCWYEVWVQNLLDEPGVEGIVLNLRDVSERKAYQSTIEYLAYHDALTGLPNRRMLREQAEQALALTKRNEQEATLIYLDLDRFKEVNDTLGHEAGDELLVQVSRRIQQCVRAGDLLARLGGDEFAILLHETTPESATDVAERVLGSLNEPFMIGDTALRTGASLGLGMYPRDGYTLDDLMRVADVAMYRAKENRAGFMFYSPELDHYSRERLNLLHDLRSALEKGEFYLEYQPILDTITGQWIKLEALSRWKHPEKGNIPPSVFIPLAEETGLVRELDRMALERACHEASSHGIPIAVNISARTLYEANFVQMVRSSLSKSALAPDQLHLEITETALIHDMPRAIKHLTLLRELGVRLSLDDFGVGHTSMGYLKELPIDVIKIDRSFIWGIGKDSREEAILNTILSLGEGLGLHTVAEGVETDQQMDWLTERGCHLLQGFGIARPQTKERLLGQIEVVSK